MEPDPSDYAAFNLEGDYEGGQWIGGEFFHEGERKKRKLTKEDQLYGVFNEGADDDSYQEGRRGRGGRGGGYMSFVPGGRFEVGSTKQLDEDEEEVVDEADVEQEPEQEDESEEEEEDEFAHVRLPTSFGGGRSGRAGLGADSSPRSSDDEAAAPPTTAWGSNYGTRLLAKMGWTGGGIKTSTGEGIDRPIEVRLRSKNEGLGFRGAEKTQQQIEMEMKQAGRKLAKPDKKPKMKKTKKKEPAWKKTLREGAELGGGTVKAEAGDDDEDEMDVEGGPSRRRRRKGGKVYKTAEEVLASRTAEKQLILDMTQAQPRVLTDMKQAAAAGMAATAKSKGGRGMPAPELQHNVKFYVDMQEMELQNIDRRIRQEETTREKLRRREERLQQNIDARAEQMKRLRTVMEIVDKCDERIRANDMPLETLEKVFDMFRNKYAREYEVYKLSSLAYSLVGPLVKGKMARWQPLKEPGLLVELVTTWRKILRGGSDGSTDDDGSAAAGEGGGDELSERILRPKGPNSTDMYNRLMVDVVLPVIRRAVVNEWSPRDVEAGIRLVRLWAPPVLTREAYENLMVHFIFPKIAREVEAWNPRQDTMPIHAWLHPWLPFMRRQLDSLFPTVRHKLGAALVEWHPSDASAHAILVPWRGVFDAGSMEALLGRSILPKLILCLRGELVINPLHQNLEPFNWVMSWADMIAPATFVPLLEMEFFPKWFAVLHNWLGSATPNFEEVSKWYSGWKQLFPADLQAQPRLQAQFNHALEIMNYHVQRIMAGGTTDLPPPSLQPPPSTASIAPPPARQPQPQQPPAPAPTTIGAKEPTMREVVARWAEDNDVLFMPQNRTHEGKQVYSFGKLAVCVDKDLVFAPPVAGSPADKWLPISFDELLARGR